MIRKLLLLLTMALLSTLVAFAQGVPIIGTPTSNVINGQNVTIDFTANANGFSTDLKVQYCESSTFTGPTLKATTSSIIAPNVNGAQAITINNLTAGKLYYYRVLAINGAGTTYFPASTATSLSFTPGYKPMISSLSATVLSSTTSKVSFIIGLSGSSSASNNTTYVVEYSTSSTFATYGSASDGNTITATGWSPNIDITLTSLAPGTLYYYRVKAMNAIGTVSAGDNTNSFTTISSTPPVISNVVSTVLSTTSAKVDYNVASPGGLTSLSVQYCADSLFTTGVTTVINVQNNTGASTQTLSGLTAGTRYYYRVKAENTAGITYSPRSKNFKTWGLPIVTDVVSRILSTTSAQVTFALDPNGYDTQWSVIYSPNSTFSSIVDSISGGLGYLNGAQTRKASIIGLTPGLIYYKIKATNATGRVQSTVGSVIIPSTNPTPALIAEFKFNNSYMSESGNISFGSSGPSFVADRASAASSAINLTMGGTSAVIPNLPAGGFQRTISFWVKANALNSIQDAVFYYGKGTDALSFYISGTFVDITADYFSGQYINVPATHQTNTWYHYVFTYDGAIGKLFRNGTLIGQAPMALTTDFNGGTFRIGSRGYTPDDLNGAIDDLKIYNYALNVSEVTSLYNNNVITSIEDIATENTVNVYPNPATSHINFTGYAELYDVLGARVAQGTDLINVTNLTEGVYILKTKSSTVKVIKK